MKLGQELLDELKCHLAANEQGRLEQEQKYADCVVDPSDCFVTDWACSSMRQELKAKIEILENGGKAKIRTLCHLDGKIVKGKFCNTRFGKKFLTAEGKWLDPYIQSKNLVKKGYKLVDRKVSAWAVTRSNGTGLSGNCWLVVIASNMNYWTGKKRKMVQK